MSGSVAFTWSIDFPAILELDANPVIASDRGAVAVDARARVILS